MMAWASFFLAKFRKLKVPMCRNQEIHICHDSMHDLWLPPG